MKGNGNHAPRAAWKYRHAWSRHGSRQGLRQNSQVFPRYSRISPTPISKLVRLVKEAAEIEQDLLIQYLYSAYALKPAYAQLVGGPAPNATSLMGVIIQEMQHLGSANRLLVELDARPVLTRQEFPYETDIYPFPFELATVGCG